MQQPIRGTTFTLIISIAALLACLSISAELLTGWVSVILISLVPAQVILTLHLGSDLSPGHAPLKQPIKGIITSGVMLFFGGCQLLIVKFLTEGITAPPSPYSIMLSITSVVVTLWIVVIFRGGPASLFNNAALGALALWITSLVISIVTFSFLFDFSIFAGAPFNSLYVQANGLLPAWDALSLLITTVAVLLALVLFDFYLVGGIGSTGLSITSSAALILTVAVSIWWVAVKLIGLNPVQYMVNGPISVVFGEFILLVMLQNSLFPALVQPMRGATLTLCSVLFALAIYPIYQTVVLHSLPDIGIGAPSFTLELWIASAMLAVTFPLFVLCADMFGFWPLKQQK